jgi:hypothetical protein
MKKGGNSLSPPSAPGPKTTSKLSRQKQISSPPPPGLARGKSLMKRGLEHQFHKSNDPCGTPPPEFRG